MGEEKEKFKRVMNTKEAAEYLGVISPRTLEKWRKSSVPKGPKWRDMDGVIGYRKTDLDDYLDSSLRKPGDDFAA